MPHPLLAPIRAVVGPVHLDEARIVSAFRRRELARGEAWLREGEVCRKLAFVESGGLRHTRADDTDGGRELTRWAAVAGQYTTSFPSFTQGRPSDDRITATAPTVVYELDRDAWQRLREAYPPLQSFWVQTLEYLLVCFEDRVWSLIAGDAESRYRYMVARYPDFLLDLPQHYLADMLGIAPRHLSRIRAKLAAGPAAP